MSFIVLCVCALGRAADSTESRYGHACSRAIRSTTSIAAQAVARIMRRPELGGGLKAGT
jgi:hypothetical protein